MQTLKTSQQTNYLCCNLTLSSNSPNRQIPALNIWSVLQKWTSATHRQYVSDAVRLKTQKKFIFPGHETVWVYCRCVPNKPSGKYLGYIYKYIFISSACLWVGFQKCELLLWSAEEAEDESRSAWGKLLLGGCGETPVDTSGCAARGKMCTSVPAYYFLLLWRRYFNWGSQDDLTALTGAKNWKLLWVFSACNFKKVCVCVKSTELRRRQIQLAVSADIRLLCWEKLI